MKDNQSIKQAADLLRHAHNITVLTGAGVSRESGVPTFRDALEGVWEKYSPEELATPMAFQRNPKLVWDWYEFRRELLSKAAPNPGHKALAALETRFPGMRIITQNVDDLHEQAGSSHVIHLHGSLNRNRCANNCQGEPTIIDVSTLVYEEGPPRCPHCDAYIRPDVVWFHEMLPADALQDANTAVRFCDVMLVVGTSGLVTPAATLPETARQHGASIIEINPQDTPITRIAQVKLTGPSGEVLPKLLEELNTDA